VASAEESTKSEYMCSECVELFTTVGYKVVEEPVTGVIPESSAIEKKGEEEIDKPATTQEPADSPKVVEEEIHKPAATQEPADSPEAGEEETDKPAATQEPAGPPKVVEEEKEPPAVTQEPAGSPKAVEEEINKPAVTQEPAGSPRVTEEEKEPPVATQEPAGSRVTEKEEELIVIQEQSGDEQGSPRPTQTVIEEEEELIVMQEQPEDEQVSPRPIQIATEEDEELVDTQKQPVDGQVSPQPTQILIEQEEEELPITQESVGNEDEDIKSPPLTQIITEHKNLVDACTQTEPPPVSDACMETDSFQELKGTWWKEYEKSKGEAFQQQKGMWFSYAYRNWKALEQAKAQYKEIKELKARLSQMFELVQRLLATRKPSFNYAIFLRERLMFLQMKAVRDGIPHQVITSDQFMQTFAEAPKNDQNMLCELYLHNEAMSEDRTTNIIPIVGDIQLRAFTTFLANQLTWQNSFISAQYNEQNYLLWIRAEPKNLATFIAQHQNISRHPKMTKHIKQLQAEVLRDCQHYVKTKAPLAIEANKQFWEHCPKERQKYHPYNTLNVQVAISRVPYYVRCVQLCAEKWIGYRFHFPLLWLSGQQYKSQFTSTKNQEEAAWRQLQSVCGFKNKFDNTFHSYCINNLHFSSQYSDSDSE